MSVSEVHTFNTCDWTFDQSFMMQLTNPGETYDAVCPFYLLEHPEGLVVVDTGLSHELLDDPAEYGRWGAPFMEDFLPAMEFDDSMRPRAHLESVGVSPDEVDYVIQTHLHSDHAGNMDLFPDAEFLIQQDELRFAWWPDPAQDIFYLDGDLSVLQSGALSVTELDGEYDVFGDGSVVTIPTPGHTPGHQSVYVETDDGPLIIGADVAHRRPGYESGLLAAFNWNGDEALASLRKVKALANERDADVYIHHDRADIESLAD